MTRNPKNKEERKSDLTVEFHRDKGKESLGLTITYWPSPHLNKTAARTHANLRQFITAREQVAQFISKAIHLATSMLRLLQMMILVLMQRRISIVTETVQQ
jgi:hypothetical protein|tara:strand:- start:132 stop:434 length:303 start_codon:yes stop_codon:yes gene_type:complete